MGNTLSSLQRSRTEEAPESRMFILLIQDIFKGWMDEVHRLSHVRLFLGGVVFDILAVEANVS